MADFIQKAKDPQAKLDYQFNWGTNWLGTGDAIESVVWTIPSGLTKESQTHDDTTATVWLSGGVDGRSYDVVCQITTSDDRTDQRTFTLPVADR